MICCTCSSETSQASGSGLCEECASRVVGLALPESDDAITMDDLSALVPAVEFLEQIGEGGMGEVYRVRHLKLDRYAALKFIRAEYAGQWGFEERFLAEGRAIALLDHPYIVRVHDADVSSDGLPYLLMEFVDGNNLGDLLRAGAMPQRRLLGHALELCEGLHHAHEAGILHLDIKPGNIIIGAGGVKVIDFGIARVKGNDEVSGGDEITFGTIGFSSPEVARGREHLDATADIYSIGAVLYYALTGELAASADPVAPSELNPLVPPDLDRILLKALSAETSARQATALELRADLLQHLDRTRQQQRMVIAIVGACFVALGAVLLVARERGRNRELSDANAALSEVRSRAERLIEDTTVAINSDLSAIGQLGILAKPTDAALRYFEEIPIALRDETTLQHQSAILMIAGEIDFREGNVIAASEKFDRALTAFNRLHVAEPNDLIAHENYITALFNRAVLYDEAGDTETALTHYQKASVALEDLRGIDLIQEDSVRLASKALQFRSRIMRCRYPDLRQKSPEKLVPAASAALASDPALASDWVALLGENSELLVPAVLGIQDSASLHRKAGDPKMAIFLYEESIRLIGKAGSPASDTIATRTLLASAYDGLGACYDPSEHPAPGSDAEEHQVALRKAEDNYIRAVSFWDGICRDDPTDIEAARAHARAAFMLAQVVDDQKPDGKILSTQLYIDSHSLMAELDESGLLGDLAPYYRAVSAHIDSLQIDEGEG